MLLLGEKLGGVFWYLVSSHTNNAESYGITIGFLERFMSFALFYFGYEKMSKNLPSARIFFNIYLFYFIVFTAFSEVAVFANRFSILFICSYWFLYPALYESIRIYSNKIIFIVLLSIYGVMKLISGNDNILCRYDNLLTGIQSYQDRVRVFEKSENSIFK